MPKPTGRTIERTRLFRRNLRGSQVHLLETTIMEGEHMEYQSACNRVKGKRMVRTDETVTCHACIGLIRQANLPEATDGVQES